MSAPLRNSGSAKLEHSRRAKHFWCVRETTAILTSKVITVTAISSGNYSYVRGFSSKIPLISVRFPKNWNVLTNSGENPQQMFTKISQESAGFFYADIRTEG